MGNETATNGQGSDGGTDTLAIAMFEFADGGIGVMADPDDNPDGHDVPHHDAGVRISFEVINVGDVSAQARVGVELDDGFVVEWQSEQLASGESSVGFVSLGRLAPGPHSVLIYVNPGSGDPNRDHQSNDFELP